MNDLVCHDPNWMLVPTKLASDIPKFKGKLDEDPGDHLTPTHMWCLSNSLNDDSICLFLFHQTLTIFIMNQYIELVGGEFHMFHDLDLVFLNQFQLSFRYDIYTEL